MKINIWKIFSIFLLILFFSPILLVFLSFTSGISENIKHIYEFLLLEYLFNTTLLLAGTLILTITIGVITAYLISNFNFYGKSFFEWALLLPLAIPPYILAYVFTDIFDSYGTANNFIRSLFNLSNEYIFFPNMRNLFGAVLVMSFSLYPYVYLVSRVAFMNLSQSVIEASKVLGHTNMNIFFQIMIPLIRPAIFAGAALVSMETLSDFGAVQHFAVQTFTVGIYKTWFGYYDLTAAMQLASMLLLIIFLFLYLEKKSRERIRFSNLAERFTPLIVTNLNKTRSVIAFFLCLIPILIGFIVPVVELFIWFSQQPIKFEIKYLYSVSNTLLLSIVTAIICCSLSLLINADLRFNKSKLGSNLNELLSIGYGMPGLILAVGITQFFTTLDNALFSFSNFYLTGTIVGLILAYIIKTYALPKNVISSGYEKISKNVDDSAQTLGSTNLRIFQKIHLPLLRSSVLVSIMFVISEVVKELPATLILRPFNFDTLAVNTYLLASEERMFEAAPFALSIILIGLIPIYFINKILRKA